MKKIRKPEFKPCPFCGRKRGLSYDNLTDSKGNDGVAVCCPCEANGPIRHNSDAAKTAWNRRTP